MTHTHATMTPADIFSLLRKHHRRWIVPAVVMTLLATTYSVVRPRMWQATQALSLRHDAVTKLDGPGQFRHDDEMKVTQETILEIARSRGVLARALGKVGPPAGHKKGAGWPTSARGEGGWRFGGKTSS